MEASQKDIQEKKKENLSLRNIVRKHMEYGVVALVAVGTMTLVNNYKHQRHEYQNQNAFNTVQNIENKVFIDRLRLSGGLSGASWRPPQMDAPTPQYWTSPTIFLDFPRYSKTK